MSKRTRLQFRVWSVICFLLLSMVSLAQENVKVTGRIIAAGDGAPLPGASVLQKGGPAAVTTGPSTNIAIPDKFYFYGIPKALRDRNPLLKQNNNWGGDFDPLQ